MAQKPSIPKGTRDFSPAEMMRRTYIFDTIKSVFRTYGFAPLETPAMENLSTLLGKYGDEGDKLLFKILNSGDYAANLTDEQVRQASRICEKGLRYDLTVPFARYVVQHQGEIAFPFKRYQVQLKIMEDLEKAINDYGATVTKEYVKGRENLVANPAIF